MLHKSFGGVLVVVLALALGCEGNRPHAFHYAQVEQKFAPGERPKVPPKMILVGDFDLGAATLKGDPTLVNKLSQMRPRAIGTSAPTDPVERLQYFGELLADDLVKDLKAKGLSAERSSQVAGATTVSPTWLVSGALLSVDEGNRRRRAVLGFGTGKSEAKLHVALADLSKGDATQPFEEMDVQARSGDMPGGAVTLRPGVAAASYFINGQPTDKDIKKAAENIADDLKSLVDEIRDGK